MTRKEAIDLAKGAATFLYEDDPDHFEGGCSDISELIAIFLRNLRVQVEVVYGMVRRGRSEPFAHAWLDILGERFDPTLWVFHEDLKRFRYKKEPSVQILLYCEPDDPEGPYQLGQLQQAYEDGELRPERPELIEEHRPE